MNRYPFHHSQFRRGMPRGILGDNQQQEACTPQSDQQTNEASDNYQQAQDPICELSPNAELSTAQPQQNTVIAANSANAEQIEDTFISAESNTTAKTKSIKKMNETRPGRMFVFNRSKRNQRERCQRRNRHLRNLLKPKNALVALNELTGHSDNFEINDDPIGFRAKVLMNNVRYEGRGISKIAAKNDASEKAFRDLIIQKMAEHSKETIVIEANKDTNDIEMKDAASSVEVPMIHLASFALHKLFLKWQNDGYEIPGFKTIKKANVVVPKELDKTELPANHQTMHPTGLLLMMRPNTKYVFLGTEKNETEFVHQCGVTVDGKSFVGRGRSKKIARKAVSISACNSSFGTNFQ